MEEKKLSPLRKMLSEAKILESFDKKHLTAIIPIPSLDKVKLTIVEQGTNGKDHVDFFFDTEGTNSIRNLFEEVLNGKAAEKFTKDVNNQYPQSYKYIGGKDGSKKLAIGGGKAGVRISLKDGENSKFSVIPFQDFKEAAFLYMIVMGIKPANYYYDGLAKIFWNAVNKQKEYFNKQ